MNKIVAEANDPQKRLKEAEILHKASEIQSSLLKEFSGLISKQKTLFDNFKPKVEIRQSNVKVKEFMWWLVISIVVVIGLCFLSYYFYGQKEKYKEAYQDRHDNYYKYRYLKVCGTSQTQAEIKKLDKNYDVQWHKLDSMTIAREKELDKQK